MCELDGVMNVETSLRGLIFSEFEVTHYEINKGAALVLSKAAKKVTTGDALDRFGGENSRTRKILDTHNVAISDANDKGEVLLFCMNDGCGECVVLTPNK